MLHAARPLPSWYSPGLYYDPLRMDPMRALLRRRRGLHARGVMGRPQPWWYPPGLCVAPMPRPVDSRYRRGVQGLGDPGDHAPLGRVLRMGDLGLSEADAAQLVTETYRRVRGHDPSPEELQAAAVPIAQGLLSAAQLEDALRHRPALSWPMALYGAGSLAAIVLLIVMLRR